MTKRLSGPTIMLYGGTYFDFRDPYNSPFTVLDIAHALSNMCRFTGHCRKFYSVAQHSVLVSRVVPPEYAYIALMHDAAEAFIGDMSKPLKEALPDYKEVEARVEDAVFTRLALPIKLPPCVKEADRILLATEQRDMMGAADHEWTFTQGAKPLAKRIKPLSPKKAKRLFLERFAEVVVLQRSSFSTTLAS